MRNTKVDLTAAIKRAIVTVRAPNEICVTNTEIRVREIRVTRTINNVL
jgi:hypothetical protein